MKGPLGIREPLVLSPMVDVTDAAFRSIAAEWGAEITCSEMAAAAGIVHRNPTTWRLVRPWPGEHPYGVQLMGSDARQVAQAAAEVAARIDIDFIDINLGCPSPNILRTEAGGFLLRDPARVGQVVRAVVAAVDVPVSIKLRTGPDEARPTYFDVVRAAEAAGASWCTLHGRSVEQGYTGHADWSAIARLVEAVDIPVVGNGDLRGPDDVVRMKAETACHGFFIARAAMHDPTVFHRMAQARDGRPVDPPADLPERMAALEAYIERAARIGIDDVGTIRRQATRFLHAAPGAKALRRAVHGAPDVGAILDLVRSLEVA